MSENQLSFFGETAEDYSVVAFPDAVPGLAAMERGLFVYPESTSDKRYFKNKLTLFAQGKIDKSLIDFCWEMIWDRNHAQTKYLYFNERSQRLYVDRKFLEWAKQYCFIAKEQLKQVYVPRKVNYKYRLWCPDCKAYTLHDAVYVDEFSHPKHASLTFAENETVKYVCDTCGSVYRPTPLNEIPIEDRQRQQGFYLYSAQKELQETYRTYSANILREIMAPPQIGYEIIETDAGYLEEARLREQDKQQQLQEMRVFVSKYVNLTRNCICTCGSNKKYKRCCLSKVQDYKTKLQTIKTNLIRWQP